MSLGFIHLQTGTDYYIGEEHGHIADVVVVPEGEGQGVGSVLIAKGEEWARSQGYRWLTLSVFAQNLRAREIYKRLSYGRGHYELLKELSDSMSRPVWAARHGLVSSSWPGRA